MKKYTYIPPKKELEDRTNHFIEELLKKYPIAFTLLECEIERYRYADRGNNVFLLSSLQKFEEIDLLTEEEIALMNDILYSNNFYQKDAGCYYSETLLKEEHSPYRIFMESHHLHCSASDKHIQFPYYVRYYFNYKHNQKDN